MENILEEVFTLFDDSSIENVLKKILISDDMSPQELKMINILIENDKKICFKRIKYIYILELVVVFGYFVDKVEGRQTFKLVSSGLTIHNKNYLTKKLEKYEKIAMINLEKTLLEVFNNKTSDTINKNIENIDTFELSTFQNIYLNSYKSIIISYEYYTKVVQAFYEFINQILMIVLRPFFFDNKYGVVRNIFNIIYASVYSLGVFFNIFKKQYFLSNGHTESEEFKTTNNIISFFENINIIIEKDKMKDELSTVLNDIIKLISNKEFIKKHQYMKLNNNHKKIFNINKILLTVSSIIVDDSYLSMLAGVVTNAMIALTDRLTVFRNKLKDIKGIMDVISVTSYPVSTTLLWNHQDEKYKNLFVLENVTVEYQENGIINTVFENINLNFEINRIHFLYGNSGSGKTTLVNTIIKRIKIKNGSINFLNEYEDYTYFSIRKYLTYMTSESALFSKSLYYNIVYGLNNEVLTEKSDAILEEIIKYMNILKLEIFISDINTKNAKKLSKGQTQRIAIIRLFINIIFSDLKIIFLDEFTSNIDNNTEKIIFKELLNLHSKFDFTIFFISHNMYNIKYSDYNYQFNIEEHSITKTRTTTTDEEL